MPRRTAPARTSARGFSIVELLVVLIILGLLSAMVLPRMLGTQGRQAEVEAQAVRSVLSGLAQLDVTSGGTFSLRYRAGGGTPEEAPRLDVERIEVVEGQADWRPMKFSRPLRLGFLRLEAAAADGQPQPVDAEWRISCEPSRPRPTISLLLSTEATFGGPARAWQIDLLPAQTTALMREVPPGMGLQPAAAAAEDLDASGRRETPW